MNKILRNILGAIVAMQLVFLGLNAATSETKEIPVWHLQETQNIIKTVGKFLEIAVLKPYIQPGKIEFNLEGFEKNSGPNNLAFPLVRIIQNSKTYLAMFLVKKTPSEGIYDIRLLYLTNDCSPSLILFFDLMNQISVVNAISSTKIDHPNVMIEKLSTINNNKTIISKWTLFDGTKQASYYVATTTDAKGETDFVVSEKPFE